MIFDGDKHRSNRNETGHIPLQLHSDGNTVINECVVTIMWIGIPYPLGKP